jgi:hypothetical protein
MIEKLWSAVAPVQLTAPGNSRGLIVVTNTSGFKVKMTVTISDGANSRSLEVKRIVGPNQMFLGEDGDIKLRADLSAFPAGSLVWALEQPRNSIPLQEIERATYDEEPAVARRVINVDEFGRYYNNDNPLPVSATLDSVQLFDKPYDAGTEANPSTTQQIFTTFIGGLSGTPVQRVTLNFVDATRENLINWQREYWNGSAWIVG